MRSEEPTPKFECVLNKDTALSNFLIDDKLLVIRGYENNHCFSDG